MATRNPPSPTASPLPDLDPWQVVSAYAPFLRIVHQIPGRVRLKIVPEALELPELKQLGADRLKATLMSVRGVHALSLNLLARSCTIEYHSATIPDTAWPDLITGRQTDAASTLIGILQEKYEEIRHG